MFILEIKKTKMQQKIIQPVSSEVYNKEYFLGSEKMPGLRGAIEFKKFIKYGKLQDVYKKALSYVSLNKNSVILDVGCGRGELVCHLAKLGITAFGIDYAHAAIEIAKKSKRNLPKRAESRATFTENDCTNLPFPNEYFNVVFMIDVIEHLTPSQMNKALKEANRALKVRGKLIIHTNNYWFEKLGYWFIVASYHWLNTFRQRHIDETAHIHINYLSKNVLLNVLNEAGFKSTIEVTVPQKRSEMKKYLPYGNPILEFFLHWIGFLVLQSPFQYFLGPSLWACAVKKNSLSANKINPR